MFDEIVYPFITNHLQGTTPQLVLHEQIIFGHRDVHNAPSLPHSTEATTIAVPLRMDDGPSSDATCSIQSAHPYMLIDQTHHNHCRGSQIRHSWIRTLSSKKALNVVINVTLMLSMSIQHVMMMPKWNYHVLLVLHI